MVFFLSIRLPPRSTRTDTLFPSTPLSRSPLPRPRSRRSSAGGFARRRTRPRTACGYARRIRDSVRASRCQTSGRPLAGRAGRRRWRSRRASGLLVFAQQRLHSGDLAAKADPREAQALEVLERDRLALHHLAGRDPRDASLEQDRIEARARRAVDRTGRPGVGVNRLEDSLLSTPTPALQFRPAAAD